MAMAKPLLLSALLACGCAAAAASAASAASAAGGGRNRTASRASRVRPSRTGREEAVAAASSTLRSSAATGGAAAANLTLRGRGAGAARGAAASAATASATAASSARGGGSCADIGCSAAYAASRACQCNGDCLRFGNCCDDYKATCKKLLRLYHQTSPEICKLILKGGFRPGSEGWCGGGIYFAVQPDATAKKAIGPASHTGCILEAKVDVGKIKHMSSQCDRSLTGDKLGAEGFDSVKFNPGDGDEFVVYSSARVISTRQFS